MAKTISLLLTNHTKTAMTTRKITVTREMMIMLLKALELGGTELPDRITKEANITRNQISHQRKLPRILKERAVENRAPREIIQRAVENRAPREIIQRAVENRVPREIRKEHLHQRKLPPTLKERIVESRVPREVIHPSNITRNQISHQRKLPPTLKERIVESRVPREVILREKKMVVPIP